MKIPQVILTAVLILFTFSGCEKDYEGVIDVPSENFQVSFISGIKDTIDLKNPADALLNLRLIFTTGSKINKAYFNIYTSENKTLNSSPVEMQPTGNNIYNGQFTLQSDYLNGNYVVKFSATGFDGTSRQVGVSSFFFNNGEDNAAPVVSNPVIEPDTVVVTAPTIIFTSVEVMDPNGSSDITEVYFISYRPDGTTSGNKLELFDDGNCCTIPGTDQKSGDAAAADGIFSRLIQVDQNNAKGTYRFEFQAKDRSGSLSNVINHFITIQ